MSKIEEYEKVNACDPGDVVLIDGSKGTRIIDVSLIGSGNNKKADAIIDTVSDPIVSFSDAGDNQPVKSCIVQITPVQESSGSGDPSPENIRPIRGWSGCKIIRTKKNILGGIALRDAIKESIPSATVYDDYVVFQAGSSSAVPIFTKFKENTAYTFILALYKGGTTKGSNLKVFYTDGTSVVIPAVPENETVCTVVLTTDPEKSIERFGKMNSAASTRVYFNESGIFEGELTAEEFVAYAGETTTIAFPEGAGNVYGGTLDVTTGELAVDVVKYVLTGEETWTKYASAGETKYYFRCKKGNKGFLVDDLDTNKSNQYVSTTISSSTTEAGYSVLNSDSSEVGSALGIRPGGEMQAYTSEEWAAYLAQQYVNGNAVTCTAKLAEPIVYHLTPTEIRTILGECNMYADAGDISVEYAVDTKTYIDNQIAAIVATLSTL